MTDYQEINENWNGHLECPHCGSARLDWDDDWDDDEYKFSKYKCNECGAEIMFTEVLQPVEVQWNPPEEEEEEDTTTEPIPEPENRVVPRPVVDEMTTILEQIREEGHDANLPSSLLVNESDGTVRFAYMWEKLERLYSMRKRTAADETRIRLKQGNGRRLSEEKIEQAIQRVLEEVKNVYEPKIERIKALENSILQQELERQSSRLSDVVTEFENRTDTEIASTNETSTHIPRAKYDMIFHNLSASD